MSGPLRIYIPNRFLSKLEPIYFKKCLIALLQERSLRSSPYSSKTTDLLLDQDFTADRVSGPLESEMSMLKDRMDDIEERQTRSLKAKNWKVGS